MISFKYTLIKNNDNSNSLRVLAWNINTNYMIEGVIGVIWHSSELVFTSIFFLH